LQDLRSTYLSLFTLYLLCSCEYKDLCYDHNHWAEVRVVFDWEDSDDGTKQSDLPDETKGGMTVLFYDMQTEFAEPIRYDFPGRSGGVVRLQSGTYRAIAYNNDTETILYRGWGHINTINAYTRYSSIEEGTQLSRSDMPRATDTEHQRVILEPDALWMATSDEFTLTEADTEPGAEATTITMQPTTRVREITITIHNVPNLQYTGQFGGALSGLAGSVWAESGEPGDELVIQAFPVTVLDESTLQMHFRTFGHCPHADEGDTNTHLLTIYAILADGNKWYYTVDVTEQIHDSGSSTDEEIIVELDGLPVPKPIVNGSGFQPTVDGWQGEEIEVDM
jgi:hypothetical protein